MMHSSFSVAFNYYFFFSCLVYFRGLFQIFHPWALWGKLHHARCFKADFSNILQLLKLLELETPLIIAKHGAFVCSSSVIWIILNHTSSPAEASQMTLVHRVWNFESLREMGSRWREVSKAQKTRRDNIILASGILTEVQNAHSRSHGKQKP